VRVLILSSSLTGFASYCLPALAAAGNIQVASVIHNQGIVQKPWLRRWRKLRKIIRIGPLGALNGVRMREWYDLTQRLNLQPLDQLCRQLNIPFAATPSMLTPA
jgi:methionyl-tRNA formyltransferase